MRFQTYNSEHARRHIYIYIWYEWMQCLEIMLCDVVHDGIYAKNSKYATNVD